MLHLWIIVLDQNFEDKGKFQCYTWIDVTVVTVVICCSLIVFVMNFAETLVMDIGSWLLDLSHTAVSVDYTHPRYATTLSYCCYPIHVLIPQAS